ncbi:hypothetical protein [Roseobacter sp. HKCCA0434]|uniref:hypothetical protein n=1 Tax=Roseobacter sp. HKCCA0434 TaxID=3079297 RepID=UPI002905DB36|nr:hypothetical protein [Roseobacter sp. HKCCA0434]
MTFAQKAFSSALILFGAGLIATDASADTGRCPERNELIRRLTDDLGESRRAMALDRRGIVEVYVSEETGRWTVTLTVPEGRTCVLAAGEYWTDAPGRPATGVAS